MSFRLGQTQVLHMAICRSFGIFLLLVVARGQAPAPASPTGPNPLRTTCPQATAKHAGRADGPALVRPPQRADRPNNPWDDEIEIPDESEDGDPDAPDAAISPHSSARAYFPPDLCSRFVGWSSTTAASGLVSRAPTARSTPSLNVLCRFLT